MEAQTRKSVHAPRYILDGIVDIDAVLAFLLRILRLERPNKALNEPFDEVASEIPTISLVLWFEENRPGYSEISFQLESFQESYIQLCNRLSDRMIGLH